MAFGTRWQMHYCSVRGSKQSEWRFGEWAVTAAAPGQRRPININKREKVRCPRGRCGGATWIRNVTNKFFPERSGAAPSFPLHSRMTQIYLEGVNDGWLQAVNRSRLKQEGGGWPRPESWCWKYFSPKAYKGIWRINWFYLWEHILVMFGHFEKHIRIIVVTMHLE